MVVSGSGFVMCTTSLSAEVHHECHLEEQQVRTGSLQPHLESESKSESESESISSNQTRSNHLHLVMQKERSGSLDLQQCKSSSTSVKSRSFVFKDTEFGQGSRINSDRIIKTLNSVKGVESTVTES
jgi:hypothetical protein